MTGASSAALFASSNIIFNRKILLSPIPRIRSSLFALSSGTNQVYLIAVFRHYRVSPKTSTHDDWYPTLKAHLTGVSFKKNGGVYPSYWSHKSWLELKTACSSSQPENWYALFVKKIETSNNKRVALLWIRGVTGYKGTHRRTGWSRLVPKGSVWQKFEGLPAEAEEPFSSP